jgi:hypothetical protein
MVTRDRSAACRSRNDLSLFMVLPLPLLVYFSNTPDGGTLGSDSIVKGNTPGVVSFGFDFIVLSAASNSSASADFSSDDDSPGRNFYV